MAISINEIQTSGAGGGFDEFIELYNSGDTAFSLNGFRLAYRSAAGTTDTTPVTFAAGASIPAHGYFLIVGPNYSGAVAGDAQETQGLATSGGIAIKDGMGQILDSVGWGMATNAFVEGAAPALGPAPGQSIARVSDGFDSNANSIDFVVLSTPTPHNAASSPPPGPHLVISEIQTTGAAMAGGLDEFIELFNPTDTAIALGGTSLAYRSAAGTSDAGLFSFANGSVIAAHAHFLVVSGGYTGFVAGDGVMMGGIAQGGGGVAIRDAMGAIVDSVGWGMANNIFIEGGTPASIAPAGQSIARLDSGSHDTNNNAADFIILHTPDPENAAGSVPGIVQDDDDNPHTLTGSSADDALRGFGGGDTLVGLGGADRLDGGDGVDYLAAGDGSDTLVGGAGGDALHGQVGNDTILGNDGDDVGIGGPGSDTIHGEAGNDTLIGDDGDDPVGGNDYLDGGDGVDQLFGYALDDIIYGGADGDFISGGDGDDALYGGDGGDALHADAGNDSVDGGAGDDVLVGYAGNDALGGGAGNDTIIGNEGDDFLNGGDGNDQMFGYDGVEFALGGLGDDFIAGGAGNDTLEGEDGGDVLDGEADDDILYGGDGGDNLNGNFGNDTLYGGAGNDGLLGLDGDDILDGGTGNDFLIGDSANGSGVRGNDTFVFRLGTGNDNVADFQGGMGAGDVLDVSDFGFMTVGQVLMSATQVAGGTYILLHDYGMGVTDAILLEGFARANLATDDIHI